MNRFILGIGWRLILLTAVGWLMGYVWLSLQQPLPGFILFIIQCSLFINLYRYVTSLNRKLTRFLESVRYSDFAVTFKADNPLGESFSELNQQFNEVLEAFRQARAEKEANLHYLNTIVQQVGVGLLSFDASGQVELINQAALRLLGIYRLRTLGELEAVHPGLSELLKNARPGTPAVYQTQSEQELSVRRSTVSLRGRPVTVASLQNIRSELQQKELDAWQNLTTVLRHEIMNSITPIVSLVGTMHDILEADLAPALPVAAGEEPSGPAEALDDLRQALSTIETRGRGIMRFVDAYRSFTAIPQPKRGEIAVEDLLRNVIQLVQPVLQQQGILFLTPTPAPYLTVYVDAGQIEMVLINLLKTAAESLSGCPSPSIRLETQATDNRVIIRVVDNGPGIEPEALEKIFIHFYTTKKTGSGIGLSLSRQIMQLHGGQLKAESTPGKGSVFAMVF